MQAAIKKEFGITASLQGGHSGVFDVVLDGVRHPRVAWSYERPQPVLRAVDQRIGFWEQVEVG